MNLTRFSILFFATFLSCLLLIGTSCSPNPQNDHSSGGSMDSTTSSQVASSNSEQEYGNTKILANTEVLSNPKSDAKVLFELPQDTKVIWEGELRGAVQTQQLTRGIVSGQYAYIRIPNSDSTGWVFGGQLAGTDTLRKVGPGRKYTRLEDAGILLPVGARIEIDPGNYQLEGGFYLDQDSISMIGKGEVLIEEKYSFSEVISVKGDHCLLQNLHLRHKQEPVQPLVCDELEGPVVEVYKASHTLIENCELDGCGTIGVWQNGEEAGPIILRGNHIHNNSLCAVLDKRNNRINVPGGYQSDIVFDNNTIESNGIFRDLRAYAKTPTSATRNFHVWKLITGFHLEYLLTKEPTSSLPDFEKLFAFPGILTPAFQAVLQVETQACSQFDYACMQTGLFGHPVPYQPEEPEVKLIKENGTEAIVSVDLPDQYEGEVPYLLFYRLIREDAIWKIAARNQNLQELEGEVTDTPPPFTSPHFDSLSRNPNWMKKGSGMTRHEPEQGNIGFRFPLYNAPPGYRDIPESGDPDFTKVGEAVFTSADLSTGRLKINGKWITELDPRDIINHQDFEGCFDGEQGEILAFENFRRGWYQVLYYTTSAHTSYQGVWVSFEELPFMFAPWFDILLERQHLLYPDGNTCLPLMVTLDNTGETLGCYTQEDAIEIRVLEWKTETMFEVEVTKYENENKRQKPGEIEWKKQGYMELIDSDGAPKVGFHCR